MDLDTLSDLVGFSDKEVLGFSSSNEMRGMGILEPLRPVDLVSLCDVDVLDFATCSM